MQLDLDFIEQVPVPTYSLRVVEDEFLLEHVNAAGKARNPAVHTLYGMPMAALYRDQPQIIEDARRCVREQTTVARELPVRRHDRTEATQYLRLTFVPAPPDQLVLFIEDVANSAVARTALNESEARYQSLMASLPDAVLLRGADGRVLFCNEAMVELCGATSQAALLGEISILEPGLQLQSESGEVLPDSEYPSRRVLVSGQAEPGKVFALVGRGTMRWIRIAAHPIRSAEGALTGSIAITTDITDRVQTQGALRESAARLELAMSAANMGVWELEPATDIGWWSPNLDEIFQIRSRDRGVSGFLAHVHPDDRGSFVEKLTQVQRGTDGEVFEHEFRIVGEDQRVRWARTNGKLSPLKSRSRIGGTMMDITVQRHLEDELRRANRLESIGRLAGGVAHDFNNLLFAMLGSVELIERHCPDEIRPDLETIRHSALRARDLTRQLLAFARKQPVAWQVLDLAALVRRVELMLRRLVGSNITIVVEATGAAYVRGDPALLEQVLVNLVVNSRDAMPNGGQLLVQVEVTSPIAGSGDTASPIAKLIVEDSGIGIDEAARSQIFDPFFTTKPQGTGLGLASSYGIIQQHRGSISVESQPGAGTKFCVSLPALTGPQPCVEAAVQTTAQQLIARRILVVDDELSVRETLARLIRHLGYAVDTAADGAEAIRHCELHRGSIDALMCDISMPGKDGFAVAAELRAQQPEVRILLMSGYATDSKHGALGSSLFLQKPFSRSELAEKLTELFHE
ncbi:MAG TPA: ATP-binding protein [Polyangiaceae bacterium]